MRRDQIKQAREMVKRKPYLVWYSKNHDDLSVQSIVEAVLNYGDWDDVLEIKEILGVKGMQAVFKEIKSKRRVNLRPQTINFFDNYFEKYA